MINVRDLRSRWYVLLSMVLMAGLVGFGAIARGASDSDADVQPVTVTVSAASDLLLAFQEIAQLYEEDTGTRIDLNFGSTGQLAQQIVSGAPVDVFAAANVAFVDELETKGLILPDTRALYGRGRIVLWARPDSGLEINDIRDLTRPEIRRIAIANPDHAPYGMAAREALQATGIWDEIQDKLVLGENVNTTFQYAVSGNVDVAIVALSLAIPSDGEWDRVPEELHAPIDQALAVVARTRHEAESRGFAAYVNSEAGREIMRGYGFVLPGEE